MRKFASAISAVTLLVAASPAFAQTKAPDPADAKFTAADVNKSGVLEGAEVDKYKTDMAKIDTNKDGKIGKDEFAAAVKAGVIK